MNPGTPTTHVGGTVCVNDNFTNGHTGTVMVSTHQWLDDIVIWSACKRILGKHAWNINNGNFTIDV